MVNLSLTVFTILNSFEFCLEKIVTSDSDLPGPFHDNVPQFSCQIKKLFTLSTDLSFS